MSYYNYHGRIKAKILSGQFVKFEMVKSHNKISPALLLYFSDGKVYPIREHMWDEYFALISTIK